MIWGTERIEIVAAFFPIEPSRVPFFFLSFRYLVASLPLCLFALAVGVAVALGPWPFFFDVCAPGRCQAETTQIVGNATECCLQFSHWIDFPVGLPLCRTSSPGPTPSSGSTTPVLTRPTPSPALSSWPYALFPAFSQHHHKCQHQPELKHTPYSKPGLYFLLPLSALAPAQALALVVGLKNILITQKRNEINNIKNLIDILNISNIKNFRNLTNMVKKKSQGQKEYKESQ